MKIFVIGAGFVGFKVADLLVRDGHSVIGTTTTPEKVKQLSNICTEVVVLSGDDAEKIAEIGGKCDAIVVTVGPNLQRASNPATREDEYRRSLSVTNRNAAAANDRVIFASSLSVYGDGGPGLDAIVEEGPRSESGDASPRYYREAEDFILKNERGAVLRFPDVYGAERDMNYVERVRLGHTLMGGRVPFAPDALLYRIHVMDAACAIVHALEKGLTGAYNVVDNTTLPPTNQTLFNRLSDENGMDRLEFMGNLRLPSRRISSEKLLSTGFKFTFTDYEFL